MGKSGAENAARYIQISSIGNTDTVSNRVERGSTTIVVVGVIGALMALVSILAGIGRVMDAQQDLQDRTDLAALAVAQTYRSTQDARISCERARKFVADLAMRCWVQGRDGHVDVRSYLDVGLMTIELHATARAGPQYQIENSVQSR
ncbi:Rv3654c family TadE-like protein [Arcanobacterium pinnipediorum]|uniref:Flp pilus-assembly TadE/G-like family protein n=1 Tax=Arcanobacterium pinnipediorum TaxID=1503041 RepID=A0ABY5AGI4_9ACTO|nr:Rv3654c family TadE-like protein [Arcanobacterium pinnipediorum]USR79310.1 flp pilus-assembly TadE/G-like family protein [Arcanobacterium pinnipediorum]